MSMFEQVVTEAAIQERVTELGGRIAADYMGKEPVLLGVLNGAVPFLADLSRHLDPEIESAVKYALFREFWGPLVSGGVMLLGVPLYLLRRGPAATDARLPRCSRTLSTQA